MTHTNTPHAIQLHNVNVTYPGGLHAIKNASLQLKTGQICGLVGMNGAGKSTLFKSLMGLITPDTGSITLNGRPIPKSLKRGLVSYVPQTEEIDWTFPILVEDVVMMGRYRHMGPLRLARTHDKAAVTQALERVGMTAYRKQQIGALSGGQRKRVFVARAIAQGGDIFLLDEPFAGVDVQTENTLIDLFKSLAHTDNKLILVSTHNLGSVPHFCDEVVLIKQTIIAHGPVENTFTQDNLALTFGDMLRHHDIQGNTLHDDHDTRGLTVLTDDERPLILYGQPKEQKIMRTDNNTPTPAPTPNKD